MVEVVKGRARVVWVGVWCGVGLAAEWGGRLASAWRSGRHLDDEFDFVGRDELEEGEDAKGGTEVAGDAVIHHGELPVGRQELEDAPIVEVVGVDTLMEVAVVDLHRLVCMCACALGWKCMRVRVHTCAWAPKWMIAWLKW